MRQVAQLVFVTGGLALLAGCHAPTRMATQVTDTPRVDLALEGGNRGYLVGTPPAAPELKTTRQIVETTIEIPSFYRPKPGGTPATLESVPAPQSQGPGGREGEAAVDSTPAAPERYDSYVVQKGDSLWSIAAKPEIYGKASRWRRLFDANRDLLKTPDRLRAGMTLKIPRGENVEEGSTTYGKDGIVYKK